MFGRLSGSNNSITPKNLLHMRHRFGILPLAIAASLFFSYSLATAQDYGNTGSDAASTTVGGYAEIQYVEPEGSARGTLDIPRFVIFLEHSFSADLTFVSEIEIEHVKIEGGEPGGEVALEQAYLQYHLGERADLRAGLVLIPMGIINEFHEPPTFNGVRRPQFDHDVIPTTWREVGVGITGKLPEVEGLQYRAYVTSGLNSDEFSPDEGIRGGRYEGREVPLNNLAFSARVEYINDGFRLGGWGYFGGSSNANDSLGTGLFDAPVSLVGLDAQYTWEGLQLRGVAGMVNISDAKKINQLRDSSAPIGSAISGGYFEVAYNLMRHIDKESSQQLLPFIRLEKFNTQSSMPAGSVANPANDRTFIIAGLGFKPTYNTAFKIDWTFINDATTANLLGALAVGVGVNF